MTLGANWYPEKGIHLQFNWTHVLHVSAPLNDYILTAPPSGLLPIGAPDPQFTFGCLPPGSGPAVPMVTTPHSFWLPNTAVSQWIGPSADNSGPVGTYCYQVEFNLPTCPTGTPVYALKGRWAADDTGSIYLNGSPTGIILPNGWAFTNWHPISITSGLVPGPNLLTFYVTNGISSTGLRVELAASVLCCGCTNLEFSGSQGTCRSQRCKHGIVQLYRILRNTIIRNRIGVTQRGKSENIVTSSAGQRIRSRPPILNIVCCPPIEHVIG